jgi:hypothetical protein
MPSLSFSSSFESSDLARLDVPVEVREDDFSLVARAVSSNPVELDPGHYHILSKLPGGQELHSEITLGEADATVILAPDVADASPDSSLDLEYFVGDSEFATTAQIALGTEEQPERRSLRARWFRGNPLAGHLQVVADEQLVLGHGDRLSIPPLIDAPALIQLQQPSLAQVTTAVPTSFFGKAILLVSTEREPWSLDVHLANTQANLLLHYRQKGYAKEAAVASTSEALTAHLLLQEKGADPIAATVGAYALLRFGDLENLVDDWTRNLLELFEWLPDGAAIRGEHLARLGRHEEAFEAFLHLLERGLPLFGEGLSFALERLRVYTTVESKLPPRQRTRGKDLLARLGTIAPFVDLHRTVLTITSGSEKETAQVVEALGLPIK